MTTTTEQHPNAAAALDLETEHTPAPQSAAREPAAPGAAGHDGQAAKGGAARKWGAEDEIAACIAWPIRNGKAKPVHELVERLARDLSDARCADAVWRWAIVSPKKASAFTKKLTKGSPGSKVLQEAARSLSDPRHFDLCGMNAELISFLWNPKKRLCAELTKMDAAMAEAARAGQEWTAGRQHMRDELLDQVRTLVGDSWGELVRDLIAADVMELIERDAGGKTTAMNNHTEPQKTAAAQTTDACEPPAEPDRSAAAEQAQAPVKHEVAAGSGAEGGEPKLAQDEKADGGVASPTEQTAAEKQSGPDDVTVTFADGRQAVIRRDAEFQKFMTPQTDDEKKLLEKELVAHGLKDPLIVWHGTEPPVLLDGHLRLDLCLKHNIAVHLTGVKLPDRAAALKWMAEHQVGRRNLTPKMAKFYRGECYLNEKLPHGGDHRPGAASARGEHLRTTAAVASRHKVGSSTLRRDAEYTKAVKQIGEACGAEARRDELAGKTGLTCNDVVTMAKESRNNEELQKAFNERVAQKKEGRQGPKNGAPGQRRAQAPQVRKVAAPPIRLCCRASRAQWSSRWWSRSARKRPARSTWPWGRSWASSRCRRPTRSDRGYLDEGWRRRGRS
jgi:hypothetical protein